MNMCSMDNDKENVTVKAIENYSSGRIQLLNIVIDRTTNVNELIEYHKGRCLIHYEENRFKDALDDIETLNRYGYMDESLLMIKWVSTIHFHVGEVRSSILQSLNIEIANDIDKAVGLLNCITEAKVDKLIQRTTRNRKSKKLKRLVS